MRTRLQRKILLMPLFASLILCCNNGSQDPRSNDETGKQIGESVKIGESVALQVADFKNDLSKAAVECVAPENPYNDNSGLDEGFKWARENSEGCPGTASFQEGCAEYRRLVNKYDECLAANK